MFKKERERAKLTLVHFRAYWNVVSKRGFAIKGGNCSFFESRKLLRFKFIYLLLFIFIFSGFVFVKVI